MSALPLKSPDFYPLGTEGRINDAVLPRIERELDLGSRPSLALGNDTDDNLNEIPAADEPLRHDMRRYK